MCVMPPRIERWLRPPAASTPLALRFGRVYAITVQGNSPYVVPQHEHDAWELILVESGCYSCTVNGETLELPAPAMLLIKPGDHHADHVRGAASFITVIIRAFAISTRTGSTSALEPATPASARACTVNPSGPLAAGVRAIQTEAIQAGALSPWLLDAMAAMVFWRALELIPTQYHARWLVQAREASLLSIRIRMQIEKDISHPPSVDELARRLGLSGRVLRLHCQRELRESPARFVSRLRIERARMLLAVPGASVSAVARQLGFASQAHFARVYGRFMGHPPSLDMGKR